MFADALGADGRPRDVDEHHAVARLEADFDHHFVLVDVCVPRNQPGISVGCEADEVLVPLRIDASPSVGDHLVDLIDDLDL
jgi:hypothetical protein